MPFLEGYILLTTKSFSHYSIKWIPSGTIFYSYSWFYYLYFLTCHLLFWYRKLLLSLFFSFCHFVPLAPHPFLFDPPGLQCRSRLGVTSSMAAAGIEPTHRGLSPWKQAHVLVPCFPQPKTSDYCSLNQKTNSPPSLPYPGFFHNLVSFPLAPAFKFDSGFSMPAEHFWSLYFIAAKISATTSLQPTA